MKSDRLTKIGTIVCAIAFGVNLLIPNETEDNFPGIEMAQLCCLVLFAASGLASMVASIIARKRLSLAWRTVPFVLPAIVLTWTLLDIYDTPNVEVAITYTGTNDVIEAEIVFGFGASRTSIKKNDAYKTDFGRATPELAVCWGETNDVKQIRRKFIVGKRIPRFGSDRLIRLTLTDADAQIQIEKTTAEPRHGANRW